MARMRTRHYPLRFINQAVIFHQAPLKFSVKANYVQTPRALSLISFYQHLKQVPVKIAKCLRYKTKFYS